MQSMEACASPPPAGDGNEGGISSELPAQNLDREVATIKAKLYKEYGPQIRDLLQKGKATMPGDPSDADGDTSALFRKRELEAKQEAEIVNLLGTSYTLLRAQIKATQANVVQRLMKDLQKQLLREAEATPTTSMAPAESPGVSKSASAEARNGLAAGDNEEGTAESMPHIAGLRPRDRLAILKHMEEELNADTAWRDAFKAKWGQLPTTTP